MDFLLIFPVNRFVRPARDVASETYPTNKDADEKFEGFNFPAHGGAHIKCSGKCRPG
jgi:hypothetical protein